MHKNHNYCNIFESVRSKHSLSVVSLNSVAYAKIVQSSAKCGRSMQGKLAHSHMIKTGHKPCFFLVNNLLNLYVKCEEIGFARKLFDKMRERSVLSYNVLISGYAKMGFYGEAIGLLNEARTGRFKLDKFSYAAAVGLCAQSRDFELGRVIHGMVVVGGLSGLVFLTNVLIDMYFKLGFVDKARRVFDCSGEVDVVSWNSLISGYVSIGWHEEVLKLSVKMHRFGLSLSTYTIGSVLKACSMPHDACLVECGKVLHGYTVKLGMDSDFVVGSALLAMYAKAGILDDAISIFIIMPERNVVMYNAMIAGLVQSEIMGVKFRNLALDLVRQMQWQGIKPSSYTFSSVIKLCCLREAFEHGKQIHAQIYKNNAQSDEFIASSLIDLYSLFGSIGDAIKCFNLTPKEDIVSWTSMIARYAQNGHFHCAVALFNELLAIGKKPDEYIISTMLNVCANLAVEKSGKQLQGYALKTGMAGFTIVQNPQIDMYAKSGDMDSARLTFEEIRTPNVVSWSIMICCSAQYGCADCALNLFQLMKGHGIAPNDITFLGVLNACSHGGLVKEGIKFYESMKEDHGIVPNVKHCTCVVDLLGRAGRIADAENFILNSGFEDNPVMWRALLSACRVYKDTITAERVAHKLIELEPELASSYVLLCNTYNEAGVELLSIRDLMKNRGVKKEPGLSWV